MVVVEMMVQKHLCDNKGADFCTPLVRRGLKTRTSFATKPMAKPSAKLHMQALHYSACQDRLGQYAQTIGIKLGTHKASPVFPKAPVLLITGCKAMIFLRLSSGCTQLSHVRLELSDHKVFANDG